MIAFESKSTTRPCALQTVTIQSIQFLGSAAFRLRRPEWKTLVEVKNCKNHLQHKYFLHCAEFLNFAH
jgi:hypothetical protein